MYGLRKVHISIQKKTWVETLQSNNVKCLLVSLPVYESPRLIVSTTVSVLSLDTSKITWDDVNYFEEKVCNTVYIRQSRFYTDFLRHCDFSGFHLYSNSQSVLMS